MTNVHVFGDSLKISIIELIQPVNVCKHECSLPVGHFWGRNQLRTRLGRPARIDLPVRIGGLPESPWVDVARNKSVLSPLLPSVTRRYG